MSTTIEFYRASGSYGFLSNLYKRPLAFEGRLFRSAEDAYQFGKPKDPAVADWLVAAPTPHLVAAAAHALFVFDVTPDWNSRKVERMRDVLRAKFHQHQDLQEALLETGAATLIEVSRTDAFWGIGKKGTGKNMLGTLLMEIRAALR